LEPVQVIAILNSFNEIMRLLARNQTLM